MIKIAICDDDMAELRRSATRINRYLKEIKKLAEITLYLTAEGLQSDINDGKVFDLMLMDITMPEKSNMDIAKMVKKFSVESLIVFITSQSEPALDYYEFSVFAYILQEKLDDKLLDVVQDAVRCIELQRNREYVISNPTRYERIPYEKVYYVHKEGKETFFVTDYGKSQVRKPICKVYSELDKKKFVYVDKGTLANVEHVMQIKKNKVFMRNGDVLSASGKRIADLQRALRKYWGDIYVED